MLVFWLALLTACDDTTFGSHMETVDAEGLEGVVQVFDGNCVGCHSAASPSAGLALDGDFCDAIIDTEALSGAGTLVVPGNKEDSVLYQRIIDASRPMPPGGVMPEANTNVVGQWIDDGADCSNLNDAPTDDDGGSTVVDGPEEGAATVMASKCVACHQGSNPSGGFGLDIDLCDQTVNQVGNSGSILVVPFDADGSLLVQRMLDEAIPMPPSGLLDIADVDIVRDWINAGAECGEGDADGGSAGGADVGNASGSDDASGSGMGSGSADGSDDDTGVDDASTSGGATDGSVDSTDTGIGVDAVPTFSDVYRILDAGSTHCTACHDDSSPAAGLNLNTESEAYTNLLSGGASSMVIPGDAEGSVLYQRVVDEARPMPPSSYSMIPGSDADIIATWINAGAAE